MNTNGMSASPSATYGPGAGAERLFEAAAFRLFAPVRPLDGRIVTIGITEDTLDLLPYRSPIDCAFLAGVLDRLASAGVAAIGLDVLLDRPTEPAKDAALRRAIRRGDVPVVAITLGPETPASHERRRTLAGFVAGVRTGYANLARDRFDDLVREHVPIHPTTGEPSFAASLAAALGVPVPTRPFPITWRRARGGHAFAVYPAEVVRLLPPDWLRGKVALVGSLRQGEDEHRTLASAFGQPSFGVEIHAQILSQILDRRAAPASPISWTEILATLGMAAAGLAAAAVFSGYILAFALAGIGAAFVAVTLAGYAGGFALLPCVAPVLAAAAVADLGRPLTGLRVDGGLTRSRLLMQAQADLLQVPVLVSRTPDATALGVAALARLGLGAGPLSADAAPAAVELTVDPAVTADQAAERISRYRRALASTLS